MTKPISSLPDGRNFVRMCIALAGTRDLPNAASLAEERWGVYSPPCRFLKAAVAAGSLLPGSDWNSDVLADYRIAQSEFFRGATAGTIIARMTGLRRVPPSVRVVGITSGASASWPGEGSPKPISRMSFDATSLTPLKVSSIIVLTQEVIRNLTPAAEGTIQADLARAISEALDQAFIDPSNSGIANQKPASVTDGAPSTPSTGNPSLDLKNVVADFEGDLLNAYWVGHPATIVGLSSAETPQLAIRGVGEIFGIPSIASNSMPEGNLALVDASAIALAEGPLVADQSSHATLQMSDTPDDPETASTVVISLYQNNLTALKIEKWINWTRPSGIGVSILTGLSGT